MEVAVNGSICVNCTDQHIQEHNVHFSIGIDVHWELLNTTLLVFTNRSLMGYCNTKNPLKPKNLTWQAWERITLAAFIIYTVVVMLKIWSDWDLTYSFLITAALFYIKAVWHIKATTRNFHFVLILLDPADKNGSVSTLPRVVKILIWLVSTFPRNVMSS